MKCWFSLSKHLGCFLTHPLIPLQTCLVTLIIVSSEMQSKMSAAASIASLLQQEYIELYVLYMLEPFLFGIDRLRGM